MAFGLSPPGDCRVRCREVLVGFALFEMCLPFTNPVAGWIYGRES